LDGQGSYAPVSVWKMMRHLFSSQITSIGFHDPLIAENRDRLFFPFCFQIVTVSTAACNVRWPI
jgi:hypothetical protein